MGPPFRLVCSLSLLVAVAGCSNLKTYPNTADKNLQVQTKLSGSFLTGVEAFLHIHRLKDSCSGDYLGTVELKNGLTQVGIAPGQPTYLAFAFNTSARLGGSFGTTSYTTILTPRAGGQYTADVSYADRIYNVSIREVGPRGAPGRELERRTRDCPKTE
ncbi:MAG TPA: hypothetical protein VK138_06415 [Acidiferrobacterales bacterium]|nr:hypothetical protein [Acidiferrobacterales bacterium]